MRRTHFVAVVTGTACAAAMLVGVSSRISAPGLGAAAGPSAFTVASMIEAAPLRAERAVLAADARVQFGQWQYAGPANIAADAVSVVTGPGDAVYALSLDGTVFRSGDAAATWSAQATVSPRDPNSGMQHLAVLPASASWPETYFVAAASTSGYALYVTSRDVAAQKVMAIRIRRLHVAGASVYAASENGLWRSDDAGQSWQKVVAANSDAGCSDVVAQGSVTYALCDDMFYRSVNGGAFAPRWQSSFLSFGQLAVSRSDPNVVYTARSSGNGGAWVHRSADAGATWTQVLSSSTATNPMNQKLLGRYCGTDINPPEDFAFAVDPLDPDVVWIGNYELYRSDDGGLNFGRASLSPDRPYSVTVATGARAIAFAANYDASAKPEMFVATSGGVYVSRNPRASVQSAPGGACTEYGTPGVLWSVSISGYTAQRIVVADVLANGEALAVIGPRATGGLYSGALDDPDHWMQMSTEKPDAVVIDPALGMDRFYTLPCGFGAACRWDWSASNGRWLPAPLNAGLPSGSALGFLAIDPSNHDRIWSGTYLGVVRTDQAGGWTSRMEGSGRDGWPFTAGAVSPADPNIVIIGDGDGWFYRRADALSSTAATVWPRTQLVTGGNWLPRTIVFDPARPQRVYATGSREPAVFASDDAGATWRAADRVGDADGLPPGDVMTLVPDPDIGDVLYAGSDTGLYVTWNHRAIDTGAPVWFRVPTPFDGIAVTKLVVQKTADGRRRIHAFTAGRGIWTTTVTADYFNDVPRSQWSFDYVNRLQAAGITNGCSTAPVSYCPGDPVLREQMAAFLLRAIHGGGYQPPARAGSFADVPAGHWAVNWIEQLRVEGVTNGCATDPVRYCPGEVVPREQIAVFLLRAKHGSSYQPPAAVGLFADVPTDSWAAAWIEQLSREGIANGCSVSPAKYCPADPVTREQMAAFLVRAFGL